jgi:ribosomal protein S8
MKFSTTQVINQVKNHSLKGLTQMSNLVINQSTLNILRRLYTEGAIQSLSVKSKETLGLLFLATINLRVVGGVSLLKNIKTFKPKNSGVALKNLDRLTFKQVTVLVSATEGITTALDLKKKRSGGILLLRF